METISVIYYAPVNNDTSARLQRAIESAAPGGKAEIYQTIEALSHRLSQPTDDTVIAVLLAAHSDDLMEIIRLRDLLIDRRIIIVLPDKHKDTIAKGHLLQPRFLTYINSDFTEISAVLHKMLQCCRHAGGKEEGGR